MKASDFKYAIKRGFLATGQGVGFYTDIVGAETFSKNLTGDIPGIVAKNAKKAGKLSADFLKDFLIALANGIASACKRGYEAVAFTLFDRAHAVVLSDEL